MALRRAPLLLAVLGACCAAGVAVGGINCTEGAPLDADWTEKDKSEWCCAHQFLRCSFNCSAALGNWKAAWSEAKKKWCCAHEGLGCDYDCYSDYDNRADGWPTAKMEWCCKHEKRGCKTAMQPYDCSKDYWFRVAWPPEQRKWCCKNKQLGCSVLTSTLAAETTAETTLAPSSTTTTATHTSSTTTPAPTPAPVVVQTQPPTLAPTTITTTRTTTRTETRTRTTTVTATTVTTTRALVTRDLNSKETCFENKVTWEPLDMPGTVAAFARNASDCQRRCAGTEGCVHFSYWWMGKNCHLQDAYAVRQAQRVGFISGPFGCWDNIDHSKFLRKGNGTFVHNSYKCVQLATLYTPLMGLSKHLSREQDAIEAVKECRAYCASTDGCAHYTLTFPDRLCRMAGKDAHKLEHYMGAVSGSPTCYAGREHDMPIANPDGTLNVVMKASLRSGKIAAGAWRPSSAAALLRVSALVVSLTGALTIARLFRSSSQPSEPQYSAPLTAEE